MLLGKSSRAAAMARGRARQNEFIVIESYVIESTEVPRASDATCNTPHHRVFDTLASAATHDGIFSVWSASPTDTARHVRHLAQLAGEDEPLPFAPPGRGTDEMSLQTMLITIPTVSPTAAAVLARRFRSVAGLVRTLDGMSVASRLKMLSALQVSKKKRIGMALAMRLSSLFTR